ncbi:MAG TPA: xanthine dehydrogenase family protein molybdopterin-binding subunit [Xanthobacteraceae bacterium]|nr:xanthine dehydrogenase family protein molybdopterin-binding subunit [Xanthobacteraceae bacterium]
MAYDLIGKNFTPPDIYGKVTGKAKYAEDFRADGMVSCRLLTSPMPHAKVKKIDASAALKLKGVLGILTADDVPAFPPPNNPILTNEPLYVGEPILAVAAETEQLAQDAIDLIKIDYEPLPFVVDPLDSLHPAGPTARVDGNVANPRVKFQTIKWTARDFALAGDGKLPMGKPAEEWIYGDLEAGFKEAKLVLDESFVIGAQGHHCMEPRSAMAYWQNGKVFVFGSSQSQTAVVPGLARYCGVEPKDLVYTAEYCGGGFGSKGNAYPQMAIPAHMSRKINRPVMMRVSRHEEYGIGQGRAGFQGRIKAGFRADGRITALDAFVVAENGANIGFWDFENFGHTLSVVYQPLAMRWQGVPVLTNTPFRGPQRGPGENQTALAMEPILDKAARQLGLDRVAIRLINAPDNDAKHGAKRESVSSAYLKEALEKGAARFKWEDKVKLSGQRRGSKVIGVAVGSAFHQAGFNGFDGLVRITPDGKIHLHTGVGNLGTYSYAATSRVAAEVLKCKWENCIIERGDSRRHLPWNSPQVGSNTSYTQSRTNYVAATDAKEKLLQIAAKDLGGQPDDYDIADEKVFLKSDPSKSLTYAAAAQRAIDLGGAFSGKEAPGDLNPITQASVAGLAGTGLIGVAKDKLKFDAMPPALAAGFIMIELDVETGRWTILEYLGVADCGTVIHPMGLANQVKGGAVMGFGLAATERYVLDPQIGLPANTGFLGQKPMSYLDVPSEMHWDAVDKADPSSPLGSRGIGEPLEGCAAAALVCAIADAMGGHYFNRTPVVPDMIVNAIAKRPQSYKALAANTQ